MYVRFRSFMLVLIIATIILSACQPASKGPQIVTSGAWGRPSPKMAMAGAVYVTIKNKGNEPDRLISASTTAAKTVELHESYMDENGVMGMRPLEGGLEIPAGEAVKLEPGGNHIMLIDLVEPLVPGTKINVALQFEKSGEVVLEVEIKAQ
ncbi:MAG TPA: copper chaperone PCu(A)C [Anaerolineales bacterium]|nr:copper chaperone PCu(A)C [Anaerolineales bacterium]